MAFAVLACAVLTYRSWALLRYPAFWAEDGTIFYGPAWNHNSVALLIQPYNGYLHLFPRLLAAFATECRFADGPLVFAGGALVVTCIPIAYLTSPRCEVLRTDAGRCLAAIIYSSLPFPDEIFCNPTNSQWFGSLIMLLIVCCKKRTWYDMLLLGLFSLSGPHCAFLAIALFVWSVLDRDRQDVRLIGLLGACAALQMLFAHGSHRLGAHGWDRASMSLMTLGDEWSKVSGLELNPFAALCLTAAVIYVACRVRNKPVTIAALVAVIVNLFVALAVGLSGGRYDTPGLWFVFLAIAVVFDWLVGIRKARPIASVIVVLLACGLHGATRWGKAREITPWANVTAAYERLRPGDSMEVPIAPKQWSAMHIVRR